jgi:uncharacterized repeat protein (TIGR02543 family)
VESSKKAVANAGYIFLGWYENGTLLTESINYDVISLAGNRTLTAKWKAEEIVVDEWRSQAGYNYFYFAQLGDDVMPIGAWSSPPPNKTVALNTTGEMVTYSTNQITLENYQVLAESGINVAYPLHELYENYGT